MKGNIHRKQNNGIQATLLFGEFSTKTKQWAKRYLNKRFRKEGDKNSSTEIDLCA